MGRPRGFDEEVVLIAATDAFWTNGYRGTSTRELVRRTGLAQPSLYNAFGDKRSLFRRALRSYAERTVRRRVSQLEETLSPVRALEAYFGDAIASAVTDPLRRGCLLVNTALCATLMDDDIKQSVVEDIEEIRRFFVRCITCGQQSGELTASLSPGIAAAHLLSVFLGIKVQAKISPDVISLKASVVAAFAGLGLDTCSSVYA